MQHAVKAKETIFTFLEQKLNNLADELNLPLQILWHSNFLPENITTDCRVYINTQTVREVQDTLSVDVVDHGRRRYNTVVACSLSFFAPRSLPNSYVAVEQIAQALKNALRRERFTCLWVRNPVATAYNQENNCYRYNVTFTYEFDEIV